MNGNYKGNVSDIEPGNDKDSTADRVVETGEPETQGETNCNCGGEGCTCPESSCNEHEGPGGDAGRHETAFIDQDAGARDIVAKTKQIINSLRSLANALEGGEVVVIAGRSGEIMKRGVGKQPPTPTNTFGIEVIFKKEVQK